MLTGLNLFAIPGFHSKGVVFCLLLPLCLNYLAVSRSADVAGLGKGFPSLCSSPMLTQEDLDHSVRVKAILAIIADPFPDLVYEALARRIATTSGLPASPASVSEFLDGTRSLGHHERAVFQEIIVGYERSTGKRL